MEVKETSLHNSMLHAAEVVQFLDQSEKFKELSLDNKLLVLKIATVSVEQKISVGLLLEGMKMALKNMDQVR